MLEKRSDIKKLDIKSLNRLADEIREEIIKVITTNGGHLASNLGVVELTIALHYVFDFPKDKLIFDVGHQCYTHKLLTREGFNTIRTLGGLSGFPKTSESEFDYFDAGHSGTALSVACGVLRARALKKEDFEIISLIGDGSISNGMSFEALNVSPLEKGKQIIILNDNKMAISPTVGMLSKIFNKFESAKEYFNLFDFDYIGQIDGHNLEDLISALRKAKASDKSVVVHVNTIKGKGFFENGKSIEKCHSYGVSKPASESFGERLSAVLCKLAEKDDKIVAVTAAMKEGVGLTAFAEKYPNRFIDTGIAEEHAVTMCAALAKEGFKPYLAVYSTFLQRGFDQILHDIMIQKLPVTLCIDHSGVVSGDGETHQGLINISYLRTAGMNIASPRDLDEMEKMVKWSQKCNLPLAIRYGKGCCDSLELGESAPIELGKWSYDVYNNSDKVILYIGAKMCNIAHKLRNNLAIKGINVDIIDAKFAHPIDELMLKEISDKKIMVLEDNILCGGLSDAILEHYNQKGYNGNFILPMAFENVPIANMTDSEAYQKFGFGLENLTQKAVSFFNET